MKQNYRSPNFRNHSFDWFYSKFSRDQMIQIYTEYHTDVMGSSPELDFSKMGRCSLAAALEALDTYAFEKQRKH